VGVEVTHIEFLVEEPSAEAALRALVPAIVGQDVTFRVHPFQGKQDLLKRLPDRLRGYRSWLPADWRIVVLIDADDEDCRQLKARLEMAALRAGLVTKSSSRAGSPFQVVNRLAVQELEAWFFGDVEALCAAYPRLSRKLATKARYRDPDAIPETWEALERELQRAGYFSAGLEKLSASRAISARMTLAANRSRSFQVFRSALELLAAEAQTSL
jgi:hypothetical protein